MPRKIPRGRLVELVEAATRVFIRQGYRRTQMADVAEALGVAKGTLYLYVESKEALFDLVARHADQPEALKDCPPLPIKTPAAGSTLEYVRRTLERNQRLPALEAALGRKRVVDAERELEGIVRELFGVLARNRRSIKLIDRSAVDHPELAALWFEGARGGLMEALIRYLTTRTSSGKLAAVPDVAVAARFVIEAAAFWAVHRHWDAAPQPVDESVAEETVVRFAVGALAKERKP